MHVYSKKIVQFINEISFEILYILGSEVRVEVSGNRKRFYSRFNRNSYPIHVAIYNDRKCLGYFDPEFYELGFHQCLMNVSKEQLRNIIRHEIAHYFTYIEHGDIDHPHGPEFRAFCHSVSWGKEVYNASSELDIVESTEEESRIVQKVKKLMALASSSNPHEAEQAMIKAQQMLLKHNIDNVDLKAGASDSELMYLKRILKQKKKNAKMQAITHILQTFFVYPVYNRSQDWTYLEVLGTATNIEIAEYVASFLDVELDSLWKSYKKQFNLKGAIAKNSFLLGIASGYRQKIDQLKRSSPEETGRALLVIENQLEEASHMAYRNGLSSSKSHRRHCSSSSTLGQMAGQSLNINPAVTRSSGGGTLLLN